MVESVVIKGGTVVDGTGSPGRPADVRIVGDRIAEIAPGIGGDAADVRVVDATGLVVAPGFLDIHTHYDAQLFWDPALTPSCFHGVTSVVGGNCGFTVAPTRPADRDLMARTLEKVEDMDPASLNAGIPWDFESFPEYLDSVRRRRTVLNYAAYVGHTALRLYVMGDEASDRAATAEEVDRMSALVAEAMEAGAAGFATSAAVTHRAADGRPIPSRLAEQDEIEALCRAVADSGRGVIAVNGGPTLGFTATYEMQERVGIPFTYVALLTTADGKYRRALEIHRAARARGVDVWPQVSCRPLTFSQTLVEPFTLNTNPVFGALLSGDLADRRAAYGDRAWREQVRQAWTAGQGIPPRWDTFEIMESAAHPELVDKKLAASAEAAGADPFDHLLDLALEEPDLRLRVRATFANDDPDGVADLLREEGCALGLSDAGAHVSQLCDAPLPTDLLGNWVRGRRALPLEAAVHKLTGEPARLFGFADRGVLATGAYADVAVFDPATVEPGPLRRVRDFPADAERLTADQPTGMHHVWVNGTEVLTDGRLTGAAGADRPGRLLSPADR